MIPPKYNFYIGKAERGLVLYKNASIDDDGRFNYFDISDRYIIAEQLIVNRAYIFVNLQLSNNYSSIFFYNTDMLLLERVSLAESDNAVIPIPKNAKYWAMRFTTNDPIFDLKKNTDFVYTADEVRPHFNKLSKKYAKESGQEFFRTTLDGKINLFDKGYESVAQSNIDDKLIFIINKYDRKRDKWLEYYKGEFSKTDCKIDIAKRKCELKTKSLDEYSEILDKYEDTHDLIKLSPAISKIDLCKRALMQLYVRGANTITNLCGGTYWEADVDEPIERDDRLVNYYHFSYIAIGNEIEVKEAGIQNVNGIYAGLTGQWKYRAPIKSNSAVLPIGYTQLNYLYADGTGYINTGALAPCTSVFDIQFDSSNTRMLMGTHATSKNYWGKNANNDIEGVMFGSPISALDRHTIKVVFTHDRAVLYVDGNLYKDAENATDTTLYYKIFGIGSSYPCKAKLYSSQFYDADGNLIRNYIPCINPNGEYGLFELINRKFYKPTSNTFSGEILVGPEYIRGYENYTCYAESLGPMDESESPYYNMRINIKRDSDNEILYQSTGTHLTKNPENYYIDEDVRMVNVKDPTDTFTINTYFVYRIFGRILCDVDAIVEGGITKPTFEVPFDDFVSDNRNYKRCIGMDKGLLFCTSITDTKPTKFGMTDSGEYFTNSFIPSSAGFGRPIPVSHNQWANASLWYVYDNSYEIWEARFRSKFTLKDCFSIGDAIKALLKKIDPTIIHESTPEYSQFLYGDINPLGLDRFYVYITQKTNILKGNYDQAAQKAEITFEGLMKMLRDCFRCYWYIEDSKLKIEHIYYFINGGSYSKQSSYQLDFTKLKDAFNKMPIPYFQSEIEYDKNDLVRRYEFGWMDDVTEVFGGIALNVNANFIQKDKVQEINIGQFSSDIDYMMFDPSNFSNDGFALLCPVKNGDVMELPFKSVQLIDENGDEYKALAQNWYASFAYLQNTYMWDMPAKNVMSNITGSIIVNGIKKSTKHAIKFMSEEDPDERELIKTSFGNGKIVDMSVDMATRQVSANLSYEP